MAIKERPRLILSDVMMPKISGFDMLDILRSTTETKDVKVIIMTALSSEDQRKRGEQLGADRYLVKSQVGIEDVVRAVHETLGDLPGVGTDPVLVSQPEPTPEPQLPPSDPEPQPVTRPDISSLSPQPAAPSADIPTTPPAESLPQQPVTPQPTPSAAQQPQPQPATLPQPTAPFSSSVPRPAGLGDRIIQPLPADDSQNSVDVSQLMAQELSTPTPTTPILNTPQTQTTTIPVVSQPAQPSAEEINIPIAQPQGLPPQPPEAPQPQSPPLNLQQ